MLKNLFDKFRSFHPEPVVYHGRHSDIWPDPGARDYGWYAIDAGAERAARRHAAAHSGVNVAPLK